jgi:hypothetical protein
MVQSMERRQKIAVEAKAATDEYKAAKSGLQKQVAEGGGGDDETAGDAATVGDDDWTLVEASATTAPTAGNGDNNDGDKNGKAGESDPALTALLRRTKRRSIMTAAEVRSFEKRVYATGAAATDADADAGTAGGGGGGAPAASSTTATTEAAVPTPAGEVMLKFGRRGAPHERRVTFDPRTHTLSWGTGYLILVGDESVEPLHYEPVATAGSKGAAAAAVVTVPFKRFVSAHLRARVKAAKAKGKGDKPSKTTAASPSKKSKDKSQSRSQTKSSNKGKSRSRKQASVAPAPEETEPTGVTLDAATAAAASDALVDVTDDAIDADATYDDVFFPRQCFSIVSPSARRSLDLQAASEVDAAEWIEGLRALIDSVRRERRSLAARMGVSATAAAKTSTSMSAVTDGEAGVAKGAAASDETGAYATIDMPPPPLPPKSSSRRESQQDKDTLQPSQISQTSRSQVSNDAVAGIALSRYAGDDVVVAATTTEAPVTAETTTTAAAVSSVRSSHDSLPWATMTPEETAVFKASKPLTLSSAEHIAKIAAGDDDDKNLISAQDLDDLARMQAMPGVLAAVAARVPKSVHLWPEDLCFVMLKYCRARRSRGDNATFSESGDTVEAAARIFQDSLAWRDGIEHFDELAAHPHPQLDAMRRFSPSSLHIGHPDKTGRVMYFEKIGKYDVDALKLLFPGGATDYRDPYIHHVEALNAAIRAHSLRFSDINGSDESLGVPRVSRFIMVVDCAGMSASIRTVVSWLRAVADVNNMWNCEQMMKLYVINAPLAFPVFWNVAKLFLQPHTVAKLCVFRSGYKEALLKLVDAEHLPKEYGGTCECDGGCVPVWSATHASELAAEKKAMKTAAKN